MSFCPGACIGVSAVDDDPTYRTRWRTAARHTRPGGNDLIRRIYPRSYTRTVRYDQGHVFGASRLLIELETPAKRNPIGRSTVITPTSINELLAFDEVETRRAIVDGNPSCLARQVGGRDAASIPDMP